MGFWGFSWDFEDFRDFHGILKIFGILRIFHWIFMDLGSLKSAVSPLAKRLQYTIKEPKMVISVH
jgi:hypothetical protein